MGVGEGTEDSEAEEESPVKSCLLGTTWPLYSGRQSSCGDLDKRLVMVGKGGWLCTWRPEFEPWYLCGGSKEPIAANFL